MPPRSRPSLIRPLTLVAACCLAFAGAAHAAPAGTAPPPAKASATPPTATQPGAQAAQARRIRQRQAPDGRVLLQGRGAATFDGRLLVFGQALGRRITVRVIDRAGDAQVVMGGTPAAPRRTRAGREFRVTGPGRFVISGSALRVELRADQLDVSAAGAGTMRLSGRGWYVLNALPRTSWSSRPVSLQATSAGTPSAMRRGAPVATAPPPPSIAAPATVQVAVPVADPPRAPAPEVAGEAPGRTERGDDD